MKVSTALPLRARFRALGTLAVLVVSFGVLVPSVGASPSLTAHTSPLPANSATVPQAILNAINCPSNSPVICYAVGRYQSAGGGRALLVAYNGNWGSPQTVTSPPGATNPPFSVLNGIDCTSHDECVAVGQYATPGGYQAMIVSMHHGVWGNAFRSPLPGGAVPATITTLNAISCTSLGNCVAVGQFKNHVGDQGLIVRERFGTWGNPLVAPLPVRNKPNFITQLDGVSCTSLGNCVAVGQYVNTSPSRQAMILTETAGTWVSSKRALLPLDAHRDPWAGLLGVTCVSRGYCVAVGIYQGAHGGQGLISVEAGGNWRRGIIAPLPLHQLPGVRSNQLLGVTCTTFGNCHVVGQYTFGVLDYGTFTTETHGHWGNAVLVPRPADGISPVYAGLNGVQCLTTTRCYMVGQYQATLGEPAFIVSQ